MPLETNKADFLKRLLSAILIFATGLFLVVPFFVERYPQFEDLKVSAAKDIQGVQIRPGTGKRKGMVVFYVRGGEAWVYRQEQPDYENLKAFVAGEFKSATFYASPDPDPDPEHDYSRGLIYRDIYEVRSDGHGIVRYEDVVEHEVESRRNWALFGAVMLMLAAYLSAALYRDWRAAADNSLRAGRP